MFTPPQTRYVKSDGVHIAYQVLGEGPIDVVFVPGFVSNVEATWQAPERATFFRRLASFCRLIMFDKRGTGMSDRTSQIFSLEQRMHDVRSIMDEVGSKRAALFGISEGGPMSLLFSATYPERVRALVLYGTYARRSWAPDYPFGWNDERWRAVIANADRHWGTERFDFGVWAPSIVDDPVKMGQFAAYFRASASPGTVVAVWTMNREIDVRSVLPSTRVPTIVIHRKDERVLDLAHARYIAERVPGAKLVELEGIDHVPWIGGGEDILGPVEEFLTGARQEAQSDRVLATVLFTDIVGSTERAVELGDARWRGVLEAFHALSKAQVDQFRGREIDTAGDGQFASFDAPARAVRCGASICREAKGLGVEVRAGVHTGEVERMGDKLGGLAVHIGARVMSLAGPGEVLASSTVKDIVAGSGLQFEDRGTHALKGVPGEWRLYRAAGL